MADDYTYLLPLVATVDELIGNLTIGGVVYTVRIPRANVTNGASAADLNALKAQTITGAGLAVGGGDLSASRVITVTKASAAEVTAGARDDVVVTPAGNLAALNTRVAPVEAGIEQVNTHPNVWPDPKFAQAASSHSALVLNGHDCVKIIGGLQGWRIPRSALGTDTTYSFSMWIEAISITGTVGNNDIIVYQEDAAQAEIAGTRQTMLNAGLGVSSTPFQLPPISGAAIDANCVSFFVRLRASTAGNYLIASRPLLAGGASAAYRAPQPDITVNGAAYDELIRTGVDVEQVEENVFADPWLVRSVAYAGFPAIWATAASGVLSLGSARNRRTLIITTGNVTAKTPAEALGGPGAYVSGSITIETVVRTSGSVNVYLQQFDAAGAEITAVRVIVAGGLAASTAEQRFDFGPVLLDAACDSVGFFISAGSVAGNSVEFSRPMLAQGKQKGFRPARRRDRNVIFVHPAGDPKASGSPDFPVNSFQRAQRMLTRPDGTLAGEIYSQGGDFVGDYIRLGRQGQGQNWPTTVDLMIASTSSVRTRIIHGTKLTGITKTAGYTTVYQAVIPFTPTGKFIHEHDRPESPILMADRRTQHRGLTHRCPITSQRKVASVALVEAAPKRWTFAVGVGTAAPGGTLYFHDSLNGDPTSNGIDYYVPSILVTNKSGGINYGQPQATGRIEVHGLEVWYGLHGIMANNVAWASIVECAAVGCTSNAFQGYASSGELIDFRAYRSGDDNVSWHDITGVAHTPGYRDNQWRMRGGYLYGAGDDNASGHERFNGTIEGVLSEFPDDASFVFVGGAHTAIRHCRSRGSGQLAGLGDGNPEGVVGEGFGCRTDPDANEGGVSTDLQVDDCESDGDWIGFGSGASAGGVMSFRATRPIVRNCRNIAFSEQTAGTMHLIEPKWDGVGTAKFGAPEIVALSAVT